MKTRQELISYLKNEGMTTAEAETAINGLESVNCGLTGRVGGNGYTHDDDYLEYKSAMDLPDYDFAIQMYYHIDEDAEKVLEENDNDGSWIDWEDYIAGYEVI